MYCENKSELHVYINFGLILTSLFGIPNFFHKSKKYKLVKIESICRQHSTTILLVFEREDNLVGKGEILSK